MTQAEIESIAREMRARCLHSSWDDLLGFWRSVVRDLESAYRAKSDEPVKDGDTLYIVLVIAGG